jgi:hypothetical protein
MSTKTRAAIAVALALLTASCGAPSNTTVPGGNSGSRQTVPTQGPGAQPAAPGGSVLVPDVPELPAQPHLPLRTPGEQPVDPGPVVLVPTTTAPPTLIPSDTASTTTEPSEHLPIPEVP